MATTPDLKRNVDRNLRDIAAETDFLPDLAAAWPTQTETQRDVWHLEWRELMGRLEELDQQYRSGRMTVAQQARYRKLLRNLSAALPAIEQLDLDRPAIPLEA